MIKMEVEWLKKKLPASADLKRSLVDTDETRMSIRRQCELLDLNRECLSEFSPGSGVEEHHVLLDGLAADVQLIGREVRVGVADRQATQDRQFRRDRQLRADDLGIPCDRDLDASPQASCSQGRRTSAGTSPHPGRPPRRGPCACRRCRQAARGRIPQSARRRHHGPPCPRGRFPSPCRLAPSSRRYCRETPRAGAGCWVADAGPPREGL